MADLQMIEGRYRFSSKYRQHILSLSKHREPGYPSFVTIQLLPLDDGTGTVKATMWYVGKTMSHGHETNRYHIQSTESGKILPAVLDETQPILEVVKSQGE